MSGYTGHHRAQPRLSSTPIRRPLVAVGAVAVMASTTGATTQPTIDQPTANVGQVDLSLSPAAVLSAGLITQQQQVETTVAAGHRAAAEGLHGVVLDAQARALAAQRAKAAAANAAAAKQAAAKQLATKAAAARARAAARAAAVAKARHEAAVRASRSHARKPIAHVNSGSPRSIAMGMLGQFGWSSSQFGCLNSLWNKESGWNVHADNPSSSAYGIPQSLPGSKMASAGPDWRNNAATQIRWGLGYIKSRYGSPCSAWGHSQSHNWY